ncbi:hypothetical protein M2389_001584 [Microbacterium phyllosphaerae]|nr:hypothetical protein [Microbacterium phyllosphaerae]
MRTLAPGGSPGHNANSGTSDSISPTSITPSANGAMIVNVSRLRGTFGMNNEGRLGGRTVRQLAVAPEV